MRKFLFKILLKLNYFTRSTNINLETLNLCEYLFDKLYSYKSKNMKHFHIILKQTLVMIEFVELHKDELDEKRTEAFAAFKKTYNDWK